MRKNELLGMGTLAATDGMVREARMDEAEEDRGSNTIRYRYRRYFMAAVEGSVLKVAVFTRNSLRSGSRAPLYEVYVDKEEGRHMTLEVASGRWRTAKLSFLEYPGTGWRDSAGEWQQETRDLVNGYFGTGKNLNVFQAVLDFQQGAEEERRKKKYRRETDQIDAVMGEVPEAPEGFRDWVERNCFHETMFYMPRGKKPGTMYCTACREWMPQAAWAERPAHGMAALCPGCGAEVTCRSWNRQKHVAEETDVAVLQRMADGSGYILRRFRAGLRRTHGAGWESCDLHLQEEVRVRLNAMFCEEEYFEYGEYRYSGVTRWCHTARRGGYGCSSSYGFGSALMYTENLKEELAESRIRHMDLRRAFRGGSRERVYPGYTLRRLDRYPWLEYLWKCGLDTLAGEIMRGEEDEGIFCTDAVSLTGALGLDGQRLRRLRQWDGGCGLLRALQAEAETGGRLSDDNIRYITGSRVKMKDVEKAMARTGLGLRQMLNYLERQQAANGWDFQQTHAFYEDYLDMAEARGMDLKDDIVRRQPRMKEYHDRYLEEKNREAAVRRDLEADQRYPGIRKDRRRNGERFRFRCGGYVFTVPDKASDITREGRLQHHCVGASDTYLSRMDSRQSFIVFLRKEEDPDSPYYTLEAKWDGTVVQWYAAYDRKPDEEKVRKALGEWSREVRKRDMQEKGRAAAAAIAASAC